MALLSSRAVLKTQPHVHLAPSSSSHERFIQMLKERTESPETVDGVPRRRATVALVLSEWGTFLRKPENDTLSMLAHIYDCEDYEAETISRGKDFAENLYVNILAGCTPAWFAEGFPPNSYEQGLPTRMVMVYAHAPKTTRRRISCSRRS